MEVSIDLAGSGISDEKRQEICFILQSLICKCSVPDEADQHKSREIWARNTAVLSLTRYVPAWTYGTPYEHTF
jgi:hypothetical protein